MQIQINTDHNIQGREALVGRLTGVVEHSMRRVAEHITRVEVHLSIEASGRSGQSDKRCAMEARLEGLPNVVVTEQAGTIDQAVNIASEKLLRAIDGKLGKLRDKSHRPAHSAAEPTESVEPTEIE